MGESRTALDVLDQILRLLAATALGVSVGAMLTGEILLVPYWRSLAPVEFLAWFGANAQRMLMFYGPLQSVSAVLAILAAIASMWAGASAPRLSILAAILAIGSSPRTSFIFSEQTQVLLPRLSRPMM